MTQKGPGTSRQDQIPGSALWYLESPELPTTGHTLTWLPFGEVCGCQPPPFIPFMEISPEGLKLPHNQAKHPLRWGAKDVPYAIGPPRSPWVPMGRGSGPEALPLWVQLWGILLRGRLAPGPNVVWSEHQGNTQRRLRSRRLWEVGSHVTGEIKARQCVCVGGGRQQAAFVAQAEQETGPIEDRQGRLSHTLWLLWLLCSEHGRGPQGQAESGSGPSGDRVTRTRNMSKSTE